MLPSRTLKRAAVAALACSVFAHADVVINEIMYRPGTGFPEPMGGEFVEIHNTGLAAVDISGWSFRSGISYTFPAATSIPAGGFVVVANSPSFVETQYAITGVLGPWTAGGSLSNSSEKITLSKPGIVPGTWDKVDEVIYSTEGDWGQRYREATFGGWAWQTAADGGDKSIELRNPAISNDNGQNWAVCTGGLGATPGGVNSVVTADIPPIIKAVSHSPAVPTTAQSVQIQCELNDETPAAGLSAVLWWRNATGTNPGAFQGIPMTGDGAGGFAATIAAISTNLSVVEWYIAASDGTNTRTWPAPTNEGQNANCQYQVNNEAFTATDSYYLLVLTGAENAAYNSLATSNPSSDRRFNMTFVSRRGPDSTVRYRADMRIRGNSSRNYQFKPLRVSIPNDDKWDGITDFAMNPKAPHLQFLGMRLFQAAGLPADNAMPIELRRNGMESSTSTGSTPDFGKWVRIEQNDGNYTDNHFPLTPGGNIYKKIDDGNPLNYYWRSTGGATPPTPEGMYDGFTKETNGGENDWTDLTTFFSVWQTAAQPHFPGAPVGDVAQSNGTRISGSGVWNGTAFTPAEYAAIGNVTDLNMLAKHLAVMTIIQDVETKLSNGVDDDYSVYFHPPDANGHRKMVLLPHDIDTAFNLGDSQPGNTATGLYNMTDDGQTFRTLLPLIGNNTTAGNTTFRALYFTAIRELYGSVFNADTNGNPYPPFYAFVDNHLTGWAPAATITAIKTFGTQRQAHLLGLIGSGAIAPAAPTSTATFENYPTSTIIISEVLPNNASALNVGGSFPDAIELQNITAAPIALDGMTLSDDPVSPKYTFPNGTTIPSLGRIVIYADGTTAPGHAAFSLDNEGETIYLRSSVASGATLLDSVVYGPVPPDYSVGRTSSEFEVWGLCTPTLGSLNVAVTTFGSPSSVRINEWLANPDFRFSNDFVELHNSSANIVPIGLMRLTDDFANYPSKHVLPILSFIGPSGKATFRALGGAATPGRAGELPFGLDDSFAWIGLIGQNGTISDRVDVIAQPQDASVGRSTDGADTFATFGAPQTNPTSLPSPGAPNVTPPAGILALINGLRVNEVLYKPSNLEYIEITNIGATTLALDGVSFDRGVTYTFPAGVSLAPGQYVVVCRDRAAFQTQFGTGVVLAPGVFAGSLDNAGESIALRPPAPWDAYILNFSYSPTWYSAADAATNNSSLAVIDANTTEPRDWDKKSTWQASSTVYGTPGNDGPPIINSPLTAAGITGDAFSYTITALKGPTSFTATPVPAGLSFNGATGVINGTLGTPGTYNITIGATNSAGSDSETLILNVAASGPVANFLWSTMNNQAVGTAFGASLVARDSVGRTVVSFNGSAGVSGLGAGTTAGIVLITETGSGNVDYFEFENVGNATANTAGWFVLLNNANGVGGGVSAITAPWPMPASVAAGGVVAVSENSAGIYPQPIEWSTGANPNGWCMLCDNSGAVRDFVAWGYTSAQITSINIPSVTVNGNTYTNITVPAAQWSGNGMSAGNFFNYIHTRSGTADSNTASNWSLTGSNESNKGVHNAGLTVPFIPPPANYVVTPSSVTFTNGIWNGDLTMSDVVNTVKLIANDGLGHTGETNTFNVEPDSDADGMGDVWEAANGLTVGANDAAGDKDGDGQSNRAEWLSGTGANSSASVFRISAASAAGGDVTITWPAIVGRRYNVAATTALGSAWSTVNSAPITPATSAGTFTHVGGGTGGVRFYRVEIIP